MGGEGREVRATLLQDQRRTVHPQTDVQVQGDQLDMAVCFWYLVKKELSSVRYCTCVNWTWHFLLGTRVKFILKQMSRYRVTC